METKTMKDAKYGMEVRLVPNGKSYMVDKISEGHVWLRNTYNGRKTVKNHEDFVTLMNQEFNIREEQ